MVKEKVTFRLDRDRIEDVNSIVEDDQKLETISEFLRYAVRQQIEREKGQ
jgi:Arc/MetJ-type ribon-helix-helix transcriptional regulator